ncbi:GxxExxY protein [Alkaliflexus imshenetskii]|uniref:GxxExxY protein n=1 Tax=Alkaliflexus imshenetskii TaxID=286730 RepID=UPI0005C5CCDE|nr:GxxExxY protein [Alkaliflexus imshenetskii]
MNENELSRIAVNAAFEIHKALGPGLLESAYEKCLVYELRLNGLQVDQQVHLPIRYKNVLLDGGYRLDIWVEKKLIIEVKSVEAVSDIHIAQLIPYLKLADNMLGLLINFNTPLIKSGIKRVINGRIYIKRKCNRC